jgi:hypothetical protein
VYFFPAQAWCPDLLLKSETLAQTVGGWQLAVGEEKKRRLSGESVSANAS